MSQNYAIVYVFGLFSYTVSYLGVTECFYVVQHVTELVEDVLGRQQEAVSRVLRSII